MGTDADVVIIGGGGSGLVAAISAAESGKHVLLLEKSGELGGHTLNTQGMFPAALTRFQKKQKIFDSPVYMTQDILNENNYGVPYETVHNLSLNSGKVAEWMVDFCGVDLDVVTDFKYPGYNTYRIHAPPSRTGREVINALIAKADTMDNLYIAMNNAVSRILFDSSGKATGVEMSASGEQIRSDAIVISTGGYGANRQLVDKYMPKAGWMVYFGSSEHRGEAVLWAEELGAELDFLDSYQAHSSVSSVGTLITWETVMKGAIIVNDKGVRFANEITGYSKFAKEVVMQKTSTAFEIFDAEIHEEMYSRYEEYRGTTNLKGVRKLDTLEELSKFIGCKEEELRTTLDGVSEMAENGGKDSFGRNFFRNIVSPYYAAKITPALFHTQGGIRVDSNARMVPRDGKIAQDVYAVGNAAAGISGHGSDGYLSGSGLLCAFTYGWLAGRASTGKSRKK